MVRLTALDLLATVQRQTERPTGDRPARQRIVLVTGPSGAGRSTAIHVLEDLGYEAIDNLPMSLLSRLLDGPPIERPLALDRKSVV